MINIWNKVSSLATSIFDLNEASLSGCVDVIVVRQKDGSLKATPFHVRFGKFHILKSKDSIVRIDVNNRPTSIVMKLGDSGEGYFEEVPEENEKAWSLKNTPINSQSVIIKKRSPGFIRKISSEPLQKISEDFQIDYIKLPNEDAQNTFELFYENNQEKATIDKKEGENEINNKEFGSILGNFNKREHPNFNVERLIYPGSSNNPRKVKFAEFIQTKIEQGKHLSEKIKSAFEREFHIQNHENMTGMKNDENMGIEENDVDMAKQVFGFISDGDEYEFLIHKKDGHSHHEIRDLNALHRIPVSEITKNPQEYVYNKNLLIKVHGVSYNYKVATYVIVALLEDKNLEENVWDESTLDIYQENEEEFHGLDSWSKYSSRSPNSNMLSSISSKVAKSSSHVFTETPPKSMERSQRSSKVKKSLRLNSDQLHSLNLKPGVNTITYTIHSSLQSTQQISANIYLWEANSKIIVTDIDGTVTKSDVLGAILPMLGKDWSQPGIVPLFSNIKRNGYQIIYLTTRAIGQISFTRSFVNNLQQDGLKLPPGPIISSPDRLLTCFRREMIISRPEYYKAAALRDIKNLFPSSTNPFYAAFGNRENDAVAYRFVGIPLENIFTVNQKGDVHHSNATFKSYPMMTSKMKELFPCQT